MTAVFLLGIQPNINEFYGLLFGKDPAPQRHHVGVVVLLGHLGHEWRHELRAAYALYLVGGYAYADACAGAISRALDAFADRAQWQTLQKRCMVQDFTWEKSAKKYYDLYKSL